MLNSPIEDCGVCVMGAVTSKPSDSRRGEEEGRWGLKTGQTDTRHVAGLWCLRKQPVGLIMPE